MNAAIGRALGLVMMALIPAVSNAGTIWQSTSATSGLGSFSASYLPLYAIDKSGLSSTYTSGVTDFDTFVATTTTVAGGSGLNTWYSAQSTLTGNFDFSLGGPVTIESFALWADPQAGGQGVKNFTLLADSTAAFSAPITLGSYTAVDGIPNASNLAQVFTFSPTTASFVRMQITSNNGSSFVTGMVETAFEQTVVPIPATAWLLGTGLAGLGGRRLMRRKISS